MRQDKDYAIGAGFWKTNDNNRGPGQPPLFATHTALWEAACQYFHWCDENPIRVKDWVGKDADQVDRLKPMPYSLAGFAVYVGASRNWFKGLRKEKRDKNDEEFLAVCARIEEICFTQQYNGAVAGVYSHHLVARALGIAEQTETKIEGGIPVVWNELKTYEDKKE